MSRLEELIQELCQDGVEYRFLGEIENDGIVELGRGKVISKKDINDNPGDYPIYSSSAVGDGEIGRYSKYMFDDERITWSVDGGGKLFHREGIKYSVTNVGGWIKVKDESKIMTKYLYYALINAWSKKTFDYIHKAHPSVIRDEYYIPVPPLEVQREIVRILDTFTGLTSELTAERTARKKQYEYYRNVMLTSINAPERFLGDVCSFIRGPFGGSLKKNCFKPQGYAVYEQQHAIYENLNIRYFVDEDKYNELKRFSVSPGDLIVSCSGTIGRVLIIPDDAPAGIINQALLKLAPKEGMDSRYIKYFFENTITTELNSAARGGAIKNVPSVAELKKIKIRIPEKKEQLGIIKQLDQFNSLANNIFSGLPAEIEARQKQYEHYRDKLLTFKEKEA